MIRLYALVLGLFTAAAALAQPANDDCANAVVLPPQMDYCSGSAAFTNEGATPSLDPAGYPICIDETDEIKDVWFSFVAQRNSVSIQVIGKEPANRRGTLGAPQFALLEGDCTNPAGVACRSTFVAGNNTPNSGSLIYNQLQRGETYYILVGSRNGGEGTFELCVNQFDAPPSPSSDCATAVLLCDKSPFAVDYLQGRGNDDDDLLSDNITCQSRPEEFNSAWYKWTCDESGTLEFDITPLGSAYNEDLDFVLYELTNGIDDCGSREVLRQMFSGENGGDPDSSIPCFGATGLGPLPTEEPIEECGCTPGDNNYVRYLDMEAGKSYALVIMNFTGSGEGFDIAFGGTGTFLGPEASITYTTLNNNGETCVGEAVTFQDQSSSIDGIEAWDWDFGPDATPRYASGAGPHDVVFGRAGTPDVTLAITSTRNCVEYITANELAVVCCSDQFSGTARVSDVTCAGAQDGAIAFTGGSTVPGATLSYRWSNGATTASLSGLDVGDYSVTISDGSGCEASYDYSVRGSAAFVFDTLVVRPDCGGGTNGALEFTIVSGGITPYEYSFNGAAFSTNNRMDNLSAQLVNVRARDSLGCEVEQDILVDELRLDILDGSSLFQEPTCNGGADGRITLAIGNGRGPYQYDFGNGYQPDSRLTGLTAGSYPVRAVDDDGCTGNFDITVTDPPVLVVDLQEDSISCFGYADGALLAVPGGGRPQYTFDWSDGTTGDFRSAVGPGTYSVTITDSLGCTVGDSITISQPEEIMGRIADQSDLLCFGQAAGSFTLAASGGAPDYSFSADGVNFQNDTLLSGLPAGDYLLYVRDSRGCLDSLSGRLEQPLEYVIDVDSTVRLELGLDTILQARGNYLTTFFQWGPDSVSCLTPDCSRVRIMPFTSGDYFVTGTNPSGCVDTAYVAVTVVENLPTFIPNAITPNNDGNNDRFTVYGNQALARVEQLRVYDRWGGLIYEAPEPFPANDPSLGWDGTVNGKLVNGGVYVYYIQVTYLNNRQTGYRGDVTVIR